MSAFYKRANGIRCQNTYKVNPNSSLQITKKHIFLIYAILFGLTQIFINKCYCQPATPCDCTHSITIGEPNTVTSLTGSHINIESNTCYAIAGTLNVDIANGDQWEDSYFIMEEGAVIQVSTSLEIQNCYLSSCDNEMWVGIRTQSNTHFIIEGSIIEGADIGINLAEGTEFICQNDVFINNYIGIAVGTPIDEFIYDHPIYMGSPITGCTFYTDNQLPDPYPGHYYEDWPTEPPEIYYDQGYAAIYLSGATGLTIGLPGSTGANRNEIYNMRNGVIMRYSTCNIGGTDFHDFVGEIPISSSNTLLDLNQHGIIMFTSSSVITGNTFNYLMAGIYSDYSMATIQENVFDLAEDIPNVSSTYGITVKYPAPHFILENEIHNGFKGIQITDASNPFLIKDNVLTRDLEVGKHTGIEIISAKFAPESLFGIILSNDITIEDGNIATGINLSSATYLSVIFNNINFDEIVDAGNINSGITMSEGGQSVFVSNTINADAAYKIESLNSGIISTSQDNRFHCNDLNNMHTLIKIVGRNTMTDLLQNKFNNAGIGLELVGQVALGSQIHHLNHWFGSFYNWGAYISGSSPDATAIKSQFTAEEDSNNPCLYIPCEYGPVIVQDLWFKNQNNPNPPATECPYEVEFTENDPDSIVSLLLDTIGYSEYNDQMTWLVKSDIYEMILHTPSLANNAILDSFFEVETDNNLGKLIQYQDELASRIGIFEDKNVIQDSIGEFLKDIAYLDSMLFTGPINHSALESLREFKVDSLTAVFGTWQGMLESENESTFERYDEISEELKNLTPTNDLEEYLIEVLLLKCKYLLNQSFAGGDSSSIFEIVDLCPWEGGRAVGIASGLYTLLMDSTISSIIHECPVPIPFIQSQLPDNIQLNDDDILVYPNPAHDFVKIISDKVIEEVYVTNANFMVFKSSNLQQSTWQFDSSSFPNGLYFIFINTGQKLVTKKISVVQ